MVKLYKLTFRLRNIDGFVTVRLHYPDIELQFRDNQSEMRNLSGILQKAPWIVRVGRIVWRLKQPKFSAGVVGVVFNSKNEVLLVEHVFHPYSPWGLPGGWMDRGENPDETIEREMKEELQLKVRVGPLLIAEVNFTNHLDFAFLCFSDEQVGRLSHELLGHAWCPINQLPRLQRFHYNAIQGAIRIKQLPSEVNDILNTK